MADNIASGVPATSNNSHRFLDTVFARESPLTEEQFSFIIHHADQGAGSADILKLLNNTWSLEENLFTVQETISYIRRNVQREQLLLSRAKQYVWCTTQHPANANTRTRNNGGRERFTDEMKAFMFWKEGLGHQKLTILKLLNAQFKTQFNIISVKICLSSITRNDKFKEFLENYAMSFDWWKPPPNPDSSEGIRAARRASRKAAMKRHADRTQVQKRWLNEIGKFESEEVQSSETAAGKGKARASPTATDGTLDRPIKIEESDGDGEDTMSDVVVTHLNEIADEMVRSPSDQLSPTSFQRAPRRSSKGNVNDGEMELSNYSDEDAGANLSEYSSQDVPESSTSNHRSGKGMSKFSAKLMGSRS